MRVCICGLLTLFLSAAPAAGAAEPQGPALEVPEETLRSALHCPEAFDDVSREPVLLVHGTGFSGDVNYGWNYRLALEHNGFDVCSVDLPNEALDDIQVASEYVVFGVRFIAGVSGRQVDVIGASQGGLQPRWAVKWWPDVEASVDDLVMLATPNHGTGAQPWDGFRCFPSCWQMLRGSNFIGALNAGDETPGDISYTSIYTRFDVLVTPQEPVSTSALDGATNILIQDVCPNRPSDHTAVSTADAVAYALALDALTQPGTAVPARIDPATCNQAAMPHTDPVTGFVAFVDFLAGGPWQTSWVDSEPPLKPYAQS